jgi:PAS domain S-box-containing protein
MRRLAADVIEHSRSEESLRSALQQLQLITDNMAAAVSQCSRDLRYLWVSRSYAAWLGQPDPEAIAGRYMPDVLGREGFESIRPHIEKVLSGQKEEFETRVTYLGTGGRWIHGVYVPTRGQDNTVDGWIAVITDITERQEAEERALRHVEERSRKVADGGDFQGYIGSCVDITDLKLAQEAALAKQKMESVGLLAVGIAHDFGNFLGSIVACTDLALSEIAEDSPAAEQVKNIQAIASRASDIVRELMLYSGQETASYEALEISALVHEMTELLKVSIPKHVTLKVDCANDPSSIRGNASQIRQVIMNLVINASEAIGKEPGLITLSVSHVSGGKELAPGNPTELAQGDFVCLDVSDTGSGMTEEHRNRIFDPFFTTKSRGRGLGLAVVQGIVLKHNGAINILSARGVGTTFQIFLPVSA